MENARGTIPARDADRHNGGVIRVSKINIYIRLMESMGISANRLLAGTDIDPELLSDPEALITRGMYYAVIMNMIRLSGNPAIAFSLGEVADISDYGIVGYAMLSSPTLRHTLHISQQFINTLLINPIRIDHAINSPSGGYELTISLPSPADAFHRFEIEEYIVAGFKYIEILTGIYPVAVNMSFSYEKPPYSEVYQSFFKCPIEFGTPKTVIKARGLDFDTPIPSKNKELCRVCTQHCQKVLQSLSPSSRLQSRLRDLFLAKPGNLPDSEAAAVSLGMTERNLRRKLLLDGLSYRSLKEEFRFDLSRELLVSGRMAPKQVAHFLGYATASGFGRAFKAWSGQTVRQFLRLNSGSMISGRNSSLGLHEEMAADERRIGLGDTRTGIPGEDWFGVGEWGPGQQQDRAGTRRASGSSRGA